MKIKKKISLRAKLVGLMVGICVLMGGSSLLMMNYLIHVQEGLQSDAFEVYAQNLSAEIGTRFFERYGDIKKIALDPTLRSSDKKAVTESLNSYVTTRDVYDLMMVVDKSGHLIAASNRSSDSKDFKPDALYQINFSETPWFKSAMAGDFTRDAAKELDGAYFEDAQVDPYSTEVYGKKRLGTSFTAPIKDDHGTVVGVVTGRTNARWFESAFEDTYELLRKQNLGGSALILFNKEGTTLYEYTNKNADRKTGEAEYDWDRLLKLNPAKSGNLLANRVLERKSGSGVQKNVFTYVEELTAYTPVDSEKFIGSIGWSIFVRDSVGEVFGKIYQAKTLFYWIFLALTFFSLSVGYLISNQISKKLLALAETLNAGGQKVAITASQISQSSVVLADSSIKQASAIQETAASIDEVSAMVKKNSENAAKSQSASQQSRESAEAGQNAIQKMIQSITEISESNALIMNQVADGNQKISEIVKLIGEIGNKTKVINDIVFQTKLLSFNASVEAARAGEHGKGFAVVAEEVGNLAKMSGNAAKEISDLLEGSIQKVEGIISETKESVEKLVVTGKIKVEFGRTTAFECGEILNQILTSVHDVDAMVREITTASIEQSQGVNEINKAMNQLDQVTQQNSQVSQTASASALDLNRQSQNLKELVGDLFLIVTGVGEGSSVTQKRVDDLSPLTANVLPFDRSHHNVTSKRIAVLPVEEKKAAFGGGVSVPEHDDPRFEDV